MKISLFKHLTTSFLTTFFLFCNVQLGWEDMPFYCVQDGDCVSGWECNLKINRCVKKETARVDVEKFEVSEEIFADFEIVEITEEEIFCTKELCDGKDNDCDGKIDEEGAEGCINYFKDNDNDKYGSKTDFKCLCSPENPYLIVTGGDCNDDNAQINPSAKEKCNKIDDNCDGKTDEGYYEPKEGICVSDGVCKKGYSKIKFICINGEIQCDYFAVPDYEKDETKCDGKDNDCDGETDENLNDVSFSDCKNEGVCKTSFSKIKASCENGKWKCDYSDVIYYQGDVEATCDGMDNDCDGLVDEDFLYEDFDKSIKKIGEGCGTGLCKDGKVVCMLNGKGVICNTYNKSEDEICGDGIDNDCDGKIDEEGIGCLIWSYTIESEIYSSPAIDDDGIIYFGGGDFTIYAINHDGGKKWSFKTNGSISTSPAISKDGKIYIVSMDANLYILNPDGNLYKKFTLDAHAISSPVILPDGGVVIGTQTGKLYKITDGNEEWKVDFEKLIFATPAIDEEGNIYFGTADPVMPQDNYFYSTNKSGVQNWKVILADKINSSCAVNKLSEKIYVGTYGGKLFEISKEGDIGWSFDAGGSINSSPVVDKNGIIYFGCNDKNLYAIFPSGDKKWTFQTNGEIWNVPLIGSNGRIYFASNDGYIYSLKENGELEWKFNVGSEIGYSSPAINKDGILYIGSIGGNFIAITTKSTQGLEKSVWPKFKHDNKGTGNILGPF